MHFSGFEYLLAMNLESLERELIKRNLGAFFNTLQPELKSCISLQLNVGGPDVIGGSRIGGIPDLPEGIEWPWCRYTKVKKKFFGLGKAVKTEVAFPMSFIAQLNCAEFNQLEGAKDYPNEGMLYFFYNNDQSAWGFDPKDKAHFKVFFYNGDLKTLKPTAFPTELPEAGRFKGASLTFEEDYSVPSWEHGVYENLSDEDQDWFFDTFLPDKEINKLGGHPNQIQGEMSLECELVTNGLYCGNPSGYNDPKAEALAPKAKFWQLLLQVDSNSALDMMWGDAGRLYFWIREQDLKNRDFDKAWMILQCY